MPCIHNWKTSGIIRVARSVTEIRSLSSENRSVNAKFCRLISRFYDVMLDLWSAGNMKPGNCSGGRSSSQGLSPGSLSYTESSSHVRPCLQRVQRRLPAACHPRGFNGEVSITSRSHPDWNHAGSQPNSHP